MEIAINNDDVVPYFCWDRNLTQKDIKQQLRVLEGSKRDKMIAWILREAAFKDV